MYGEVWSTGGSVSCASVGDCMVSDTCVGDGFIIANSVQPRRACEVKHLSNPYLLSKLAYGSVQGRVPFGEEPFFATLCDVGGEDEVGGGMDPGIVKEVFEDVADGGGTIDAVIKDTSSVRGDADGAVVDCGEH